MRSKIQLYLLQLFTVFSLIFSTPGVAGENEARARQNYILNCQGCHLPDATGSPGIVPNMKDYVGNFLHVPGGREFIVRVPGAANAPISDAELAELMNWLLVNFSKDQIPADFRPYTADEVGKLRKQSLINIVPVRKNLTDAIEKQLRTK